MASSESTAIHDAWAVVDRVGGTLVELSHSIFDNPELMWEEHHAHDVLTGFLEDQGMDVERGAYGLPTAFRADAGDGNGPLIAVFCEYDALPAIGHACGHNVIGTAGAGASVALAQVVQACGGRLRVLGSPAEEGGNAKGIMTMRGALDGVDAAMMVHPGDRDLRYMTTLAATVMEVTYRGKAAHVAAAPWNGRNAMDAAVAGYTNIAALRQHIGPDDRVHGMFTTIPERSNIVPELVEAKWVCRSRTYTDLAPLRERVVACLEAGALGAGCEFEMANPRVGSQVVDNDPMIDRYAEHAGELGREVAEPLLAGHVHGSTDMGFVSRTVPSIHPVIKLAPEGVCIHEREFADYARSRDRRSGSARRGEAARGDDDRSLEPTGSRRCCQDGLRVGHRRGPR